MRARLFTRITLAAALLFAAGPRHALASGIAFAKTAASFKTAGPAATPFTDLNDSGLASVILTPALYESSLAKLEPLFTGDPQAFTSMDVSRARRVLNEVGMSIEATAPKNNLSEHVLALDEARKQAFAAVVLAQALPGTEGAEATRMITQTYHRVGKRLIAAEKALMKNLSHRMEDLGEASWYGRTAVLQLSDGSLVALKSAPENAAENLQAEGEKMRAAGILGLGTPLPLGAGEEAYVRRFSPKELERNQFPKNETYLPYLIGKEHAQEYFSYLGDALPNNLNGEEKAEIIAKAAFQAIDELTLLNTHNLAHESLAPLSHSEAGWRWDYWRESYQGRRGPTSIHNWRSSLAYANLRLSGLADFEHVNYAWEELPDSIGQNLTEWSLLVAKAGAQNGLNKKQVGAILKEGFLRHANVMLAGQPYSMHVQHLEFQLNAFAGSFLHFHRLSSILPRPIVWLINKPISMLSVRNVPLDEAVVLSGSILQRLVMGAVRPYVQALQEREPLRIGDGPWESGTESVGLLTISFMTSVSALLIASIIKSWGLFPPQIIIAVIGGLTSLILVSLTVAFLRARTARLRDPWLKRKSP
ncbi:MAG: hypothetical protein COB53_07685 [Elusimicrobia bacterium]|nr:MAG: hypothetical protein COB53_07685 [Elusimicrobiota bacterium]